MKKNQNYSVSDLLFSEDNLFSPQAAVVPQLNEFRSAAMNLSAELLIYFGQSLEKTSIHEKNQIVVMDVKAVKNPQTQLIETVTRFDFVEDSALQLQLQHDMADATKSIRDNISAWSAYLLVEFCKELEAGSISGSDADLMLKHYQDLKDLLLRQSIYKGIDPKYIVLGFLHKGLKTGVHTTYDIVRSVPITYFKSQNHVISIAQLEEAAMNSLSLLTLLSSMQIKPFIVLKNFSKVANSDSIEKQNKYDFDYPAEIFYFDTEKKQLRIKSDFLSQWRQIIEEGSFLDSKRIGCPARKPAAQSKNSTIQILLKHQLSNFIKYVGPHLETYTSTWA